MGAKVYAVGYRHGFEGLEAWHHCPKKYEYQADRETYEKGFEDGKNKRLGAKNPLDELIELRQAAAQRDALLKFEAYVHQRFDEAGIPADDPNNEHSKAGCRVGARFDMLLDRAAKWREAATGKIPEGCSIFDHMKSEHQFSGGQRRIWAAAQVKRIESLIADEGGGP